MPHSSRREFLSDVGRGMLIAGLGASLGKDLGFSIARADDDLPPLSFGEHDALVDLLQNTPAERLQPIMVGRLQRGETNLRSLIAASALANAEAFGGQDYVGFHTAMAMLPALSMSELLPDARRPLPVLKVMYRNAQQLQAHGGASVKTLYELHVAEHGGAGIGGQIRDAVRRREMEQAERLFAAMEEAPLDAAFNALQPTVQDDVNVHRYVFAHRTRGLVDLIGAQHAHTLLRQCVRFCIDSEENRSRRSQPEPVVRQLVPRLLDQYKLEGISLGTRDPGDNWVDETSLAIYLGPAERSAEIVAAALADGIDPEVIGEAISLASNLLVLRQGADVWRAHGDAKGVHSSDATNAWRNMVRVTEPQFAVSGLIVAGYHAAVYSPFATDAFPLQEHRAAITATEPAPLLAEAEEAVRQNDQGRAAAAIAIYGEHGYSPEAVYNSMLKYTLSEDGRLHGEKYFHTVREEFVTTREAFRWRHLVGLARVTASAYGYDRNDKHGFRAPGYEEACGLLGVPV